MAAPLSDLVKHISDFSQQVGLENIINTDISQLTETSSFSCGHNFQDKLSSFIDSLQLILDECRKKQSKETEKKVFMDPDLVQIIADKTEIERRISAFIKRKRLEVDENNLREFGRVSGSDLEEWESQGCARTNAVFKPRTGGTSHVKATKVINAYGPQTARPPPPQLLRVKGHPPTTGTSNQSNQGKRRKLAGSNAYSAGLTANSNHGNGVEERLSNMEKYTGLKTGQPVTLDVYERLKHLEDRILQLEGLSLEYFDKTFHQASQESKKIGGGKFADGSLAGGDISILEIDDRIKDLKMKLKGKESVLATQHEKICD